MASPGETGLAQALTTDFLTCQICHDVYRTPKVLPCVHSFCEDCLRDYVVSRNYDSSNNASFPCPLCMQPAQIPDGGVSKFPSNHLLVTLVDRIQAEGTSGEHNQAPTQDTTPRPSSGNRAASPRYVVHQFMDIQTPVSHGQHGTRLCFGKYGQSLTDFTEPCGMVVSHHGYYIVADKRDSRIIIFEPTGQVKSFFTCVGEINGLAINSEDQVLVGNASMSCELINVYRLNGERRKMLGRYFSNIKVCDVAVLGNTNIVVTSDDPNQIIIITNKGRMVQKFGSKGSGPQHIHRPLGVAGASMDTIVVSDTENHRLKVCSSSGSTKRCIASRGVEVGKLDHPLGVCTDKNNNIIVADSNNRRIQVFTKDGKNSKVITKIVSSGGHLVQPKFVSMVTTPSNASMLAVMVTGYQFAEIQVYTYTTIDKSSVCSMQ